MTLPRTCKYERNENPGGNCSATEIKIEMCVCSDSEENCKTENSLNSRENSQTFNDNDLDERNEAVNCCSICLKKFTAKKNLLKHLREVHKNYSEAERMVIKKLKCPEKNCDFLCRMARELRNHIEKSHQVKILKDTLQFPSEEVFQKWKKEEESNTVSWFVSGRQKTTLVDGTKKQFFYCHRTGHYNPKGFGKYRMRSVGSCKIGVTCPAAMEVTESVGGEITVIYYKTHLGHMQDAVYLKLTKEEENHLEEKIKQGFSFDSILEDVKESKDVKDEKKRRIHLLSKKDLYRIMNRSKKSTKGKSTLKESSQKATKTDGKEPPVENMQPKKEEGICQNLAFYPPQSSVVSLQEPLTNNQTSLNYLPHQTNHGGVNIPQMSTGGVTSQIVILPPNVDYTAIPEIIFLSAGGGGGPAQPETLPQRKLEALEPQKAHDCEAQTAVSVDVPSEQSTCRGNKSKLYLQLKEKLEKILECLPHSEHLTPRQFDLINTKLDGILAVFKVVNEKARTRKKISRKAEVKQSQNIRNTNGGDEDDTVRNQGQQHYKSPIIYAMFK